MPILPEFIHSDDPTLSPSQINAYLMCPLKYRFNYIDKLPRPWKSAALAFGSAVHSALEAWQMSRLSGEEISADEVEGIFLADWESEKVGDVRFKDDEESGTLMEKGRQLVRLAMDTLRPDLPLAVELPFVVDLPQWDIDVPPVKLRGIFDLLLPGNRLVEIKTASKRFDPWTLERHIQLSAYAYAHDKLMGTIPDLEIVTLLKTKVSKVEVVRAHRKPEDMDWFLGLVHQVHAAIVHRSFFPCPSFLCGDCEFVDNCRAWSG